MSLKPLLAAFTLLLCSHLHAQSQPQETQRVQEMRSLAYLAIANLMVVYNLDATPFEAENIDSYQQSFKQLQQLATTQNYSLVVAELEKIEGLSAQLEALPRDPEHIRNVYMPYQLLLNPIFEAQQRIDQDLEQRYQTLAGTNGNDWQQGLNALSLDHSRIMQQYAMLTFTGLAYLNTQDPTLSLIDSRIQEQFERLKNQHPEHKSELEKLSINYNFIRKKMVGQPKPWIPARALFYLSRNAIALDTAATSTTDR